jgi:hypothetical protein
MPAVYDATFLVDHGVSMGMGSNYPDKSEVVRSLVFTGTGHAVHTVVGEQFMAAIGLRDAFKVAIDDIIAQGYLSNPETGLVRIALKQLRDNGGRMVVPSRDDALESRVILSYSPMYVLAREILGSSTSS